MDAQDWISNCPELHKRVLEIRGASETMENESHGQCFHFSFDNDGDYWFF